MVKALVLQSTSTDPYVNLATERLLMDAVSSKEQIMFLWQNSNTIVIGRNQDAFRECKVAEFEGDGGHLARRLSGGGAVFHDSGNLNFTFISPRGSYDTARNMDLMCRAVRSFGIDAQVSGRNDAEVDGAKFSGNAFFKTKYACCHHGTLMVDVDTERLARYLQPDPRKLAVRGVESVRSRVVNLHDLDDRISIGSLSEALIASFSELYGAPAAVFGEDRLDKQELERERERFASDEWRLGSQASFDHRFDQRYAWGGIDVRFSDNSGIIEGVKVYSDALDTGFADALAETLQGTPLETAALGGCFESLAKSEPSYRQMLDDFLPDFMKACA